MEKTKTYKVGNDIFDIPENEEAQFLKDVQGAVEVQSFVVGKDTFDIPLNEVSQFQIDVPNAKPLKKKDESVSETPSISPTRLTKPLTVGQEPDKMKGLLVEKPASIFTEDKNAELEADLIAKDGMGKPWKVGLSNAVNAWADAAKLSDYYLHQPSPMMSPSPYSGKFLTSEETKEFIKEKQNLIENPVFGEFMSDIIMKADPKLKASDLPSGDLAKRPDKWYEYFEPRRAYITLAHNIPLMGSMMAASAINAPTGTMMMMAVEGGQANEQIDKWNKEHPDQKVDADTRAAIVTGVGVVNGLLEKIGIDAVMGKIPGAKGKIAQWLMGSTVEGTTEALQELTQIVGEDVYNKVDEKDWARLWESGSAGLIMGIVGGGVTAANKQIQEIVQAKHNSQNKKLAADRLLLDELKEEKKSKLFEDESYLTKLMDEIPNEYNKSTRKQTAELLAKKDELKEKLDKSSEKLQPVYEKQIKEVDNKLNEVIGIAEGLIEPETQIEKPTAPKTKKPTKPLAKEENIVEAPKTINTEVAPKRAEITPSPISESNTPTGIKIPESTSIIPEEVQVAESTAKRDVVQNITPGQKIKVGELTLEGEAAEEYLGFVEKYGKEKADDMMGVADTQHNFLDKADFIKETKGKESEIEPGTYVYDNPLEEGIKIRVKAKSKDEANTLAYQQYKDTREQQYAESLKPPDNAQEITPPVSPSSPTEVRDVGEQTGEEVYMGDTEKVREESPQATEVKTKEQRLASARSVEELRELINDRSYNIYDKDYLKKDSELRKAGLFNSDDVEIKTKKADAKRILDAEEKAKKEAPSGSSFVPFFHAIKKTIESVTPRRKAERTFSGLVQEYLGERRGLSVPVHDAVMSTDGKIRARLYDVKNTAHAAIKDAETAYKVKKLTDAQYEAIQKALETMGTTDESRAESLKNIPIPLHKTIIKLRNDIDAVTEELKTLELIGPSLEVKFDKNKGYYLTRSYKKYTDDNWTWNVIPNAIKEKAVGVLAEYIPQASADELIGTARAMLESSEVADLIAGKGRFAKFNKDILKKRSDFLTDNPEIRELLGENRDPFFNYALSMSKMIEMAERAKLVENIRDMAIKNGWGSERPSNEKNHIAKITGKAFKTTGFYTEKTEEGETVVKTKSQGKVSPLGEFYVTPEMAEIINNYNDAQKINSPLWRLYYKAMNRVKLSKTAYSIKSQVRNVQSNAFNYIANGNWINIIETSKEIASRFKNDKDGFIRELKERTIIDDSARTGEIVDNIRRMSNHLSFLNDINKSASLNIIRKADDIALKLYSGGDDIWKAFRYVSEYLNYKKAYEKTMTPEVAEREAKARASKIMHRTSTYYSMVPKLMQQLRRLPTNGTFISFPYLTARNFIGTIQTAYEDVTNPNTAGIGVSRIIGLSTAVTALTIASSLINKRAGIDDDDLEDLRRFLPEFWQNDIINITKQYGDGVFSYNNASYLDYYNQVTRPVQMLYRKLSVNGVIKDTDITDAIGEFFEPFVSWDILFDRLTNLKSNSDENGSPIYNPSDELQKKLDDQVLYVLEAFEPGTMTDSRRIFKTWRQGGDWKKPLIGVFTGRQSREIDIKKALDFYMIPDIKDRISNDLYIYKKQKRQYDRIVNPVEIDKKRLNDAYGRAVAAVSKTITDATVDYEAAKRQGVTDKDLTELYTKHKLDNDVKNSILGLYDWKIDPETGSITIKIE